jgi:hypothetical protein
MRDGCSLSRLREREGTRREAVGRVRVFFLDVIDRV